MPLPIRDILNILLTNFRRTGLPIPVDRDELAKWCSGLEIPRRRATILYTGLLYQMAPYIVATVEALKDMEEGRGMLIRIARRVGRIVDVSRFIPKPDKALIDRFNGPLYRVAKLLEGSGIDFGYLYGDEPYSGVLLYDLGLEDAFREHAVKVHKLFRDNGVERIITVDPHSTYVFRDIYPKYVDGFSIDVVNYLELITVKEDSGDGDIVIHDPCYYARYCNIIDEPRRLLIDAGYNVLEPGRSRRLTFCCGGPIESISPKLSGRIAENRLGELESYSKRIVTMCPICLANLSRISRGEVELRDIAEYLYPGV